MGQRRAGRELALQVLYGMDLTEQAPGSALEGVLTSLAGDPEPDAGAPAVRGADRATRDFALALVRGVASRREEIDRMIAETSEHWRVDRMPAVDRNILRLAIGELLGPGEVPASVVLDEAIELAKSFGTEASPAFVNGVLDRVAARVADRAREGRGHSP
jgi:N utilization substance protein B